MGARRRHAVEREPAQERPRAVLQRASEQDTGVLALQRSAGNRAVAQSLQVARDEGATAVPMDATAKKGATLKFDDREPFAIESFSVQTGAGQSKDDKDSHKVYVVARNVNLGGLVSKIPQWSANGHKFKNVDIVVQSSVIHLHDVYISEWKASGGFENPAIAFTLDYLSMAWGDENKDKPQGTPDQPRFD